jgi:hypothetical protein
MAVFSGIALAVQAAVYSAGFSATTAILVGAGAANLARSVAFSLVLNALTPTASIPKQKIQATINQAVGSRTKLYGQGLLGGTRALWEVTGNRLFQVIVVNHGRVDSLLGWWIDSVPVTVDDGFVVTAPYANSSIGGVFNRSDVLLDWRDGSGEGGDYEDVKSTFPTIWTDDHKLLGQATVRAAFRASGAEEYSKLFPKGPNTDVQIELKGSRVYDFRTGLTQYSDNSALCIADHLNDPDGWDIPYSKFDASIWSKFADLSDEPMVLKAGGTSPRYRLWGVVSLTDDPKSTLARMENTCSAKVYQTADGKVGVMGGKYVAPDFTITGADIFKFALQEDTENLKSTNVVKAIYTSEPHRYKDTEADPWEDTVSLLTEPERSLDLPADMVPEHPQTRRLMKLHQHRSNRPFTLTIITNLVGIKARFPAEEGYHVIRVQYEDDGFVFDEVCEVVSHVTTPDATENGGVKWRCTIELASISPAWNEWDAVAEEGDAPVAPAMLEYEGIPTPTITELSQFVSGSGQGVRVTVLDISRPDLVITAQIKLSTSSSWSGMVATDLEAESVGRTIGSTYDVRVKFNGGEYSDTSSITIIDPEAP